MLIFFVQHFSRIFARFFFGKKIDDNFIFSATENIIDDEKIMKSAIKLKFDDNDYVQFNSNSSSSKNFNMKKITLKSSTIK